MFILRGKNYFVSNNWYKQFIYIDNILMELLQIQGWLFKIRQSSFLFQLILLAFWIFRSQTATLKIETTYNKKPNI